MTEIKLLKLFVNKTSKLNSKRIWRYYHFYISTFDFNPVRTWTSSYKNHYGKMSKPPSNQSEKPRELGRNLLFQHSPEDFEFVNWTHFWSPPEGRYEGLIFPHRPLHQLYSQVNTQHKIKQNETLCSCQIFILFELKTVQCIKLMFLSMRKSQDGW